MKNQVHTLSYFDITTSQLYKGLEQYGLALPEFSSNYLDLELKKPNSDIKKHLYNSYVSNQLLEEIQQHSLLQSLLIEQRIRENEETDYKNKHENNQSPEQPYPTQQAADKVSSDTTLVKLREQQDKLSEEHEQLKQDLREQTDKQGEATEKFHTQMDQVFHEQAQEIVGLIEENIAARVSDATTDEEKASIQEELKPLQEILEDFKESIKRDAVAMQKILQETKNDEAKGLKDPAKTAAMIHKHINIQEFKLKILEMQLRDLQFSDMESITRIFLQYGKNYLLHYFGVQEEIQQTKTLIQELKLKEAELAGVERKISDRENMHSGFDTKPHMAPKPAPTGKKPVDDEDEDFQQSPTNLL